jgi:hypothetical protein
VGLDFAGVSLLPFEQLKGNFSPEISNGNILTFNVNTVLN